MLIQNKISLSRNRYENKKDINKKQIQGQNSFKSRHDSQILPLPSLESNGGKFRQKKVQGRLKELSDKSLISNIGAVSHFLTQNYITSNDINWALLLRKSEPIDLQKVREQQKKPFNVFYTSTISFKNTKSVCDTTKTDLSQFNHLWKKRPGKTDAHGVLDYLSSLRTYSYKSQAMKEMERKWCSLPRVEKRELPQFRVSIAKEKDIRAEKKKSLLPQDLLYPALDGYCSFPKYNDIKIGSNTNSYKHLRQGITSINNLRWELDLRKK